MQSSAAVAGRALIMLACVVGIPVIALSGISWSEMLKKLQDFNVRWPAILTPASASTSTTHNDPPRFADFHPADSHPMAGPAVGPVSTEVASQVNPTPAPWGASQEQPAAPMQSAVVPAGYQASAELAPVAQPATIANSGSVERVASSADPFRSVQDRLRQLGSTYYLLETWGNDQQMYRFYCKMAVGGSPDYTRYFEASDSDPLQAMFQVLRQVETWKEGGK